MACEKWERDERKRGRVKDFHLMLVLLALATNDWNAR